MFVVLGLREFRIYGLGFRGSAPRKPVGETLLLRIEPAKMIPRNH